MTQLDKASFDKIEPGDKVTIELFVQTKHDKSLEVRTGRMTGYWVIPFDCVVGHTPAPRDIKVGSRVRHKHGGTRHWEVIAIHKTKAWLFCSIYSEHLQAALENLVETE